jgi:hypothetical protein
VTVAEVWLAGEGRHELGRWAREPSYRDGTQRGVLEALARKVEPDGWRVKGATPWKNIRQFATRPKLRGDAKNVLGAALDAHEAGCDALVFSRDTDGDPDRARDIVQGLERAKAEFAALSIVGGGVEPRIEAWVLALRGHRRTEELGHLDDLIEQEGLGSTERMVQAVDSASIDAVPADARSLRAWIGMAREELAKVVGGRE